MTMAEAAGAGPTAGAEQTAGRTLALAEPVVVAAEAERVALTATESAEREAYGALLAQATALDERAALMKRVSDKVEEQDRDGFAAVLAAEEAAAEAAHGKAAEAGRLAGAVADRLATLQKALDETYEAFATVAAEEQRTLKRRRDEARGDKAQELAALVSGLPEPDAEWTRGLLVDVVAKLLRVDAETLHQLAPAASAE